MAEKREGSRGLPGSRMKTSRLDPSSRMPSPAAIEDALARNPAVGRVELLSNWFDFAWPQKNMPDVDASFAKWCARHEPRRRAPANKRRRLSVLRTSTSISGPESNHSEV
jgi:hypothetical protein